MNTNNIFYVVLSVVSILITGALIPYLKSKGLQVKAAEQIYKKSGQGQLKKQYVLMRLNEQGIKISKKELGDMIEASVLELNRWKEELKK